MDITYLGRSCFTCKGKAASLTINPDRQTGKIKTDMVLSGLKDEEKSQEVECAKLFDWPGEYEMKGVAIMGIPAYTKSKTEEEGKEDENGKGEKTIIFYFEIDGIKICHLGRLGHKLTGEMIKELDAVDILLVPVGKDSNLTTKKTIEVIEAIDPRIIIPMSSEQNPGEFLKELGAEKVEAESKFSIKSAGELPVDSRKYVVLEKD